MTVWVLNLDAEAELASARGAYAPSRKVAAHAQAHAARTGLPRPGDVVLSEEAAGTPAAPGTPGAAWCPTPSAMARLRAAGATPPAAPDPGVLATVNDRAFGLELYPGPLGSRYARDTVEVREALARRAPHGFLLKRALGFAGRGRRIVEPRLTEQDIRWCEASFAGGRGVVVEPRVERLSDFAQHGHVGRDGALMLGVPTRQHCDAHGAWLRSEPAGDALSVEEIATLAATAATAGAALHRAGYFGPFGIDAFRYVHDLDPQTPAAPRLHPLVELNARFTMGYAVSGCPIP